jgi:predicted metal-dependent hydrolase
MDGISVSFTVRKNARARRVWIKMEDELGLVVVLPRWARPSQAPEILLKHKDWVFGQLTKREERRTRALPPLGTTRTVVYRGRPLQLCVKASAGNRAAVEWHRDHVLVQMPAQGEPWISEILEASYRDRAREIFSRRVQTLSGELDVRPKRIEIRDQKTRWGACAPSGTVTFNWRLVLAPPAVLDYVVAHELCHLRHANHGRRFWDLLSTVCPQFMAHRHWLRENGALLRSLS